MVWHPAVLCLLGQERVGRSGMSSRETSVGVVWLAVGLYKMISDSKRVLFIKKQPSPPFSGDPFCLNTARNNSTQIRHLFFQLELIVFYLNLFIFWTFFAFRRLHLLRFNTEWVDLFPVTHVNLRNDTLKMNPFNLHYLVPPWTCVNNTLLYMCKIRAWICG